MEPHIAAAEWLVAAELMAASLHERNVVEKYHSVYRDDLIEIRDGPAVSFNGDSTNSSFTLDGSIIDEEDITLKYWSINCWSSSEPRRGVFDRFSFGSIGVARFKAGWIPENAPEKIKLAIVMTAAVLHKHPDQSIIMEKIGDYTRQTASLTSSDAIPPLSPHVRLLLREFRRPRL
jgi:hypothetical protein